MIALSARRHRVVAVGLRLIFFVSANATTSALADDLACAPNTSASAISAWRLQVATGLQNGDLQSGVVANKLNECFGPTPPVCLKALSDYSSRNDVAPASDDVSATDSPEKTPPDAILAAGQTGAYVLPTDIEATAAQRGWLTVRYKSRHSGGFDRETPSLLMVYVPGDKVNPPVGYDRWLNFALPADTDDDALLPTPQAAVPTADDYAAEADSDTLLPRTFTMVSVDRKTGPGAPAKVYFQKFYRYQSGSPNFVPEANSAVDQCYGCHPNGLRAISPLGYHVRDGETQLDPAAWSTTKLINNAMELAAGHSAVSWRTAVSSTDPGVTRPLLKPEAQGPKIGASQPLNGVSRSQAFIMGGTSPSGVVYNGCFQSRTTVDVTDIFGRPPGAGNIYTLSTTPSIRWQKVAAAMACETCHNNRFRGALNRETSLGEIDFKILVDQSMPQGSHQDPLDQGAATAPVHDTLTGDERIALANCLRDEFALEKAQLAKWLTATACQ